MEEAMRRVAILLLLMVIVACGGCSSGNPQQLLETAQFEEKQNNKEHATKLYQEILTKHANAPQAKTARERLQALQ
jgi:TolA-binding protein